MGFSVTSLLNPAYAVEHAAKIGGTASKNIIEEAAKIAVDRTNKGNILKSTSLIPWLAVIPLALAASHVIPIAGIAAGAKATGIGKFLIGVGAKSMTLPGHAMAAKAFTGIGSAIHSAPLIGKFLTGAAVKGGTAANVAAANASYGAASLATGSGGLGTTLWLAGEDLIGKGGNLAQAAKEVAQNSGFLKATQEVVEEGTEQVAKKSNPWVWLGAGTAAGGLGVATLGGGSGGGDKD